MPQRQEIVEKITYPDLALAVGTAESADTKIAAAKPARKTRSPAG